VRTSSTSKRALADLALVECRFVTPPQLLMKSFNLAVSLGRLSFYCRARKDSWISSSPVRGQSNRAEGFDSRIVGHTEVIQNTSYCITYADINKTSHTNPGKPRLDRVGY
jgi:hypothetical protein